MPLLTIGAVPQPPGVTPNLQHPRNAGRLIVLVGNIVCIAVVQLAFLLRCYVKYTSRKRFTIEDWSCTVAWITITMYATVGLMMYKNGMGFHAWDLSTGEYSQFLKLLYIQSLLYGPTVFSTKATLLLLTSRVCSVRRTISKGINIFICFLVICYIPLQVIKTVICLPIRAYWDTELSNSLPNTTCLNQGIIFVADSCIAVITDAVILIIPVVLVRSMRLSLYKKFKVAVLLGAGGVAVAVTASRVPLLFRYEYSTDVSSSFVLIALLWYVQVSTQTHELRRQYSLPLVAWVLDLVLTINESSSLEQTIGFVCACLPFFNLLKLTWRRSPRQKRLLANIPRTSHRAHSGPRGASRGTYDTSRRLEASSSARRRDRWLASGSTTKESQQEQSSEYRRSRIADEEAAASHSLARPESVLLPVKTGDSSRT